MTAGVITLAAIDYVNPRASRGWVASRKINSSGLGNEDGAVLNKFPLLVLGQLLGGAAASELRLI